MNIWNPDRIIDCPYGLCTARLKLNPKGNDPQNYKDAEGMTASVLSPWLIPLHIIKHPRLNDSCPASLMHWPLRAGSREVEILNERFIQDHDRLDEEIDTQLRHPRSLSYPESRTLRNNARMGREPPPKSKAWGLNGREDEDIQPEAIPHEPPPGVQGQGVGKVSIQETAAALQGAAIKLGEARAELADILPRLQSAIGAVREGRDAVQAAKGDVNSETLNAYISLCLQSETDMNNAYAQLEDVGPKLGEALELGDQYSNAIHS